MKSDERLGNRISQGRREVARIRKNIAQTGDRGLSNVFTYRIFKPKRDETSISMDRLDLKPHKEIVSIAKKFTDLIDRPLYGWAMVIYQFVVQFGFTVKITPTNENPCHVDLHFPVDIQDHENKKIKIREYAQILLEHAEWVDQQE